MSDRLREAFTLRAEQESSGQQLRPVPIEFEDRLTACEAAIGYSFADRRYLLAALTHASGADTKLCSNERLEFLGDAVLGLVICEYLFECYPSLREGELTKIKSVVVSRRTCAHLTEQLGLACFLIVGKGMATHKTIPSSVQAAVYEAIIAAVYLDGGWQAARDFILRSAGGEIQRAADGYHGGNYKSMLQHLAQRELNATPTYEVLDEAGPDHRKIFKVAAAVGETVFPAAWGRNKKEAQQRAALNALSHLAGKPIPYPADAETLLT